MISERTTQDWQCCVPHFPLSLWWPLLLQPVRASQNLKTPLEIIANPNRQNIFYEKIFRQGQDVDFFETLLSAIVGQLQEKTVAHPLTVLYLPLKWCGFAYKYFERNLGGQQYMYYPPNADALPENRLFTQFYAHQTRAMREQILQELALPTSKVRVIFVTVSVGMGVDIPSIRQVIYVGPPVPFVNIFKKQGEQTEMENLPLLSYITTVLTLQHLYFSLFF